MVFQCCNFQHAIQFQAGKKRKPISKQSNKCKSSLCQTSTLDKGSSFFSYPSSNRAVDPNNFFRESQWEYEHVTSQILSFSDKRWPERSPSAEMQPQYFHFPVPMHVLIPVFAQVVIFSCREVVLPLKISMSVPESHFQKEHPPYRSSEQSA